MATRPKAKNIRTQQTKMPVGADSFVTANKTVPLPGKPPSKKADRQNPSVGATINHRIGNGDSNAKRMRQSQPIKPISTHERQAQQNIALHRKGSFQSLHDQNPRKRRMRQKIQQSSNAPEDIGNRIKPHPAVYRIVTNETPRQKIRFSHFGKRCLLVMLCYLILMPISLLIVRMWLPHHASPVTESFTYLVGESKKPYLKRTLSSNQVKRGDAYYVDMTAIAEYCKMTTTGNQTSLRYVIRENGESVIFQLNDSIAYVNGHEERTEGDAFTVNHRLFVPLSFINRCFLGLSATLDLNKHTISISRELDESGNYAEITLRYRSAEKEKNISYDELAQEIKNQIDRQYRSAQLTPIVDKNFDDHPIA